MLFIDSHSHIDFPDFDQDIENVLDNARQAGVEHIIVSGTTAQRWPLIKNLTDSHTQCHPAYGLHPMFMDEHKAQHLDLLKSWLKKEHAQAVGEIGLDYFIPKHDKQAQLDLFIAQLEIANEFNLPVIIHARKSLDIVLKQLRRFPHLVGSIHSFSGSEQQARQCIDLGFYLGFGGPITYTRATRLRKLVTQLPLESILLETDSPDQPDANHFAERNEPAYLLNVAQTIADLRGIELADVAQQTTYNAQTLFKLGR